MKRKRTSTILIEPETKRRAVQRIVGEYSDDRITPTIMTSAAAELSSARLCGSFDNRSIGASYEAKLTDLVWGAPLSKRSLY